MHQNTLKKISTISHLSRVNGGFGFIDVLIGTALMLLVFLSIFSVFKLSIELIAINKTRIGALSIVQEQIEYVRSLSYLDVGTFGGIPNGSIPQTEIINLNGVDYTKRTLIQYVDDPKDGEGGEDLNGITADYKRVKVEVSWSVRGNDKKVSFITNIVPKGMESLDGGGTLIINVFDALGVPIQGANVHIENDSLNPAVSIDVSTNDYGRVVFPGAKSGNNYEIVVSKSGYSSAQTYDVSTENPNPSPGHLSIIESETTVSSFQIDKVSSKTIRTFTPVTSFTWSDLFDGDSRVASSTNITIQSGQAELFDNGVEDYVSSGLLLSDYVTHNQLYEWVNFTWNDTKPTDTDINYQIYYEDLTLQPRLIPDTDLPGNSSGFTLSPVDLSSIDVNTYPKIAIGATLSTLDASSTPAILDWGIDYFAGPIPFPNVPFNMRGTKVIGEDGEGNSIYKYDNDLQTNSSGVIDLINLEWDEYNITIDNAGFGYNFSEVCSPQPRSLSPNTAIRTDLILVPYTTNSLLVDVRDTNGSLLEGAIVRLYRGSYDTTQLSSSCGQSFFDNLSVGTVELGNPYSINVSLTGYSSVTFNDVDINGTSEFSIMLESL